MSQIRGHASGSDLTGYGRAGRTPARNDVRVMNMLISAIIASLIILVILGVAVAIEQADSRRSVDFDIGKRIHDRYLGARSLPL
jgi:hypothetical protein